MGSIIVDPKSLCIAFDPNPPNGRRNFSQLSGSEDHRTGHDQRVSSGNSNLQQTKRQKELQERFSRIDFSQLESESDQRWRNEREEHIEELRERIQDFKKFLKGSEESDVAVVSHSAFLNETLYGRIGDEANQLKHCHPYPLDLN